ncbi:hypothetical protein AGMMS50233_02230 [Endomicrobiia bacterium]|nr:hypothetical protein AGMMS50233_02230 [Endomicrobiia bacterium]
MESINELALLVKVLTDTACAFAVSAPAVSTNAPAAAANNFAKNTLIIATDALKHAYTVINAPAATINKDAFEAAQAFTNRAHTDYNSVAAAASDVRTIFDAVAAPASAADNAAHAAFCVTAFAEYVVAKIVENVAHHYCACSPSANSNAPAAAANNAHNALAAADDARAIPASSAADADVFADRATAAAKFANAADAFAKKAKDLERHLNDRLQH